MEEKMMMMKKRGEKSTFSITCSRLSQYLKEKGSLAAINGLEMAPAVTPLHLQPKAVEKLKAPTTLNLLPGVDASAQDMDISKSMEPFAHKAGLMEESNLMPPPNKEAVEKSPPPPPLTIFYDGKVLVFNGIPADKAEGLMKMASKESAHQKLGFAATNSPPPSSSSSSSAINGAAERPPTGLPKPIASDMPIARRSSLHRFLEKRKDRIISKAPYYIPMSESPVLASAKPDQTTLSWLGLGQPSFMQRT